jgi:hypothetical protein
MGEYQYLKFVGKLGQNFKAGFAALIVKPNQYVIDNERQSLLLFPDRGLPVSA